MNNNNNSSSAGGIGVLGLLQVAFIVLKVLDMISWSWWAVFIPAYIGIGLYLTVFAGMIIYVSRAFKKKKR